jgi:membrane fusion protein
VTGPVPDLFRPESIESTRSRLYGEVVIHRSPPTIIVTVALTVIAVLTILFVVNVRYARTERVQGVLVPVDGAARVYAMRPGIVTQLLVHDDEAVAAGQKVAVVSTESPSANGALLTQNALASIAQQSSLAEEQVRLLDRRAADDVARLDGIITGLKAQALTQEKDVDLQRQLVSSVTRSFEQIKPVVTKGYVSKLEYERRYQAVLSAQQTLGQLGQQLIATRSDIARSIKERIRARIDGQNDRVGARSNIETLRQQRGKIEGEASYGVEAPVSGRVTALQITAGRSVVPTVSLMSVIPDNAQLRADLFVPSRAIGFLKPGQEVRLMYDAFPYQRFGSFIGHVVSISRQVVAGAEIDAPFKVDGPVYRVTAVLDRQSVSAFGDALRLRPGMTLNANVVLERQSFWDWIASPVRAVSNRS